MYYRSASVAIMVATVLLSVSCDQTQPPAPKPETQEDQPQVNTVKKFSFPGGTFEDGRISVAPGYEVEPGSGKNVVTLMRPNGNGIKVTCFCILEGGECWAVSNPTPDGGVGVGCASMSCAGGEEPFCFMDITDDRSVFNIRLTVASMQ